jgi:hypothetical protein
VRQAVRRRCLCECAIDNLIDRVDRFPFTGTATKNENTRDELELRIIACVMAVIFAVFAQNDIGDADGLTAVTAQDPAKLLRRQFDRHEDCSLDKSGRAWKLEDTEWLGILSTGKIAED